MVDSAYRSGRATDSLRSDRALQTQYGAQPWGDIEPIPDDVDTEADEVRVDDDPARPTSGDPWVARIAILRGTHVPSLRRILATELDAAEVPHVVRLLGRGDVYRQALSALQRCGDRITGQLLDALLDPHQPPCIRRRIPRALAELDGERGLRGLAEALEDPRFEVRLHCAHALAKIHERRPDLSVPRPVVEEALRVVLAEDAPDGQQRSLEYAFVLLGLLFPTDAIHSAYAGVRGDDPKGRAVALEYLENVLPSSLRPLLARL